MSFNRLSWLQFLVDLILLIYKKNIEESSDDTEAK